MEFSRLPIGRRDILEPLVSLAFAGDEKLLSEYHIAPGDLAHCVDNTLGLICMNAWFYKGDMEWYSVNHAGGVIGYTIIIRNEKTPNELYSFGINIKSRTEEVRKKWLEQLGKLLEIPYYIVLWSKNTRAINFFERNGFSVLRNSKYLNDETKTLIVCRQEAS